MRDFFEKLSCGCLGCRKGNNQDDRKGFLKWFRKGNCLNNPEDDEPEGGTELVVPKSAGKGPHVKFQIPPKPVKDDEDDEDDEDDKDNQDDENDEDFIMPPSPNGGESSGSNVRQSGRSPEDVLRPAVAGQDVGTATGESSTAHVDTTVSEPEPEPELQPGPEPEPEPEPKPEPKPKSEHLPAQSDDGLSRALPEGSAAQGDVLLMPDGTSPAQDRSQPSTGSNAVNTALTGISGSDTRPEEVTATTHTQVGAEERAKGPEGETNA